MDTLLNLPADLDGLAREIEANLAEEARAEKTWLAEHAALDAAYASGEAEADKKYKAARKPLRLERGRLLLTARGLVPAGEWETWCRENVKLSASDIRAVIKLARGDDPKAALAEERANATERKRKSREKASAVTCPVTAVPQPGGEANDGEAVGPAMEPRRSDVFATAHAMAAEHGGRGGPAETRWWKVPGLLEAEPRNAEEVQLQYHALGWLEAEAMKPFWDYDYDGAKGDKLEEAQKFFPTKKAWQEWIAAAVKTCPVSTRAANQALAWSRKARVAAADKVAARQARLREECPAFAALCAAGDQSAIELIWAATDIWEEAANTLADKEIEPAEKEEMAP